MDIIVKEIEDKKVEDIIYFVKKGDTIVRVAELFCVRKEDLARDNDLGVNDKIEEGDILWIRKRNTAIHIVKPLETFASIAKSYNVTVSHIKEINNIDTIFIGQRLII